jgi:predicted P-loop ATPase
MGWTKQSIDDVKRAAIIDEVVGDDAKLTREGDDMVGCCTLPGHKDDTPSLRVSPSKGLWRCHGCNSGGSAVDWLMMRHSMKFPDAMRALSGRTGIPLVEETKAGKSSRRLVASYPYQSAAGETLYVIERWEPGKQGRSKDILQRHADGSYGKHPHQVLYRLPEVLTAVATQQPVYVCEGEKATEALVKLGVCATTHAGGASAGKTWLLGGFIDALRGADVVLVPDHDDPGRKLMARVAAICSTVARSVTTVHLPVTGDGDDAVEWIAAGGTKRDLEDMAENAAGLAQAENASWKSMLRMGRDSLRGSPGNLELVLENDPMVRGLFAYDEFASRVVITRQPPWSERNATYPRALVDADIVRLAVYMEKAIDADFATTTIGAVVSSVADRAAFNPLTDWLGRLSWDGTPRLSKWLHTYAGAEDNAYTHAVARAWAISTVARALRPGCQVDTTLVLEGTQGKGKSSLLRALVGSEWFMDHLPDFSSKDAAILVAKAWVHELSELATLSRSEVEKIKQFLSQRHDVYRAPYAANTIDVPRKCVFAATTNRSDYLRDTTGNRRFWPVKTTAIDVAAIARDRDQIWAEAVVAFRSGEGWHISDPEVLALAQEEQSNRVEVDPWLDAVARFVEAVDQTTTADCLKQIGVEVSKRTPRDGERVCGILRCLGWTEERQRTTTGRVRVWKPKPSGPEAGPELDQRPLVHTLPHSSAVSEAGPKGPEQNAKTPAEVVGALHTTTVGPHVTTPVDLSFSFGPFGPLVPGRPDAAKSGPEVDQRAPVLWSTADEGPDPWSGE